MTREEAIQYIEGLRCKEDFPYTDTIADFIKERNEAIDMAIEALSADTVEVVRCKYCTYWNDAELHVCKDKCYGVCIIEELATEANNWCEKGVYKWK